MSFETILILLQKSLGDKYRFLTYNISMARKIRKDRVLIIVLMTLVFTIAILILINTILNIFIKEGSKPLAIDYNYKIKDDLLDLPKTVIDDDHISGDMYKSYEDEIYTSRLGLDVSSHQKKIDWSKVKAAGIDFVYIRCGYRGYQSGLLNTDEMFYEHYKGAKEAGLDVGVYFFSHAIDTDEAIEEAYYTYELIKDLDIDLEVVYDLEDIDYDTSRLEDVTSATRTDCAIAFASKIEELGYKPMIYTNLYWTETHYDLEKIMNYPLWYAQYSDTPDFPYYYTLWQYTDSAKIDGIDVLSDLNLMLVKK